MKHMRRIQAVFFALLLCVALPYTAQAQTTIASDDGEAYSSGYIGENEGTGFNAWVQTQFGGDDQGGTFLASGGRELEGSQGFAMFAGDTGSGAAVSRSFSTPLSGSDRYQTSFLIQFDLDPNAGQTAGFVLSETDASTQTNVFDGQQLFIGIDGSGVWGFDSGSGYQSIGDGSGGTFSANGGQLYRVTVDVVPANGEFDLQVENLSDATESAIESGALSTAPGTDIATIGFAHGVTGSFQDLIFDDITVVTDPTNPLPVELASFTAALDGTTAQLQWETLSETNNAGFEVQHAAPEGDFEAQGFVEGQGTTDTPQQYSFRVDDLPPGTHQFRLKQTDFDGTSTLTEVQTVEVALDQTVVLNTAPNPVRGNGTVQFAVQQTEPVTVSVYNMLGQRVETLYEGTPTPDQVHTVSLDTSTLSSGTYFVRIEGATMQKTRRVAVVR